MQPGLYIDIDSGCLILVLRIALLIDFADDVCGYINKFFDCPHDHLYLVCYSLVLTGLSGGNGIHRPRDQDAKKEREYKVLPSIGKKTYTVGFFVGCIMDRLFLKINDDSVKLLQLAVCEALLHHSWKKKKDYFTSSKEYWII
ncbi:hypothetical protein [Pseudobacillus wudalianchiensis]|uniref:Uncharacterized protein n=1 Tax=Pseudobacillus wudalianchiensis TaxID=1743143 RepID=A0A1B9AE30_9BACI|nr:hypothetical protein [Bacillus wudalianchiensis]OCA82106.1 hypothetical protein A8F95_15530 [Bacillus wudalianchiensis]